MDPLSDLLIYSMLTAPAIVGAAYGWGGWRTAGWTAAVLLIGIPGAVVLWGLLPTGCEDCVGMGLYMPVVWLFVIAISQGFALIGIAIAALIGWALGRWLRSVDDGSRLDGI